MRTIWKFPLNNPGPNILHVPGGSECTVLHVGEQDGAVMAWIEIDDTEAPLEPMCLVVYGTGHFMERIPDTNEFWVGTVQMKVSGMVWHVFDRTYYDKDDLQELVGSL